MTAEERIRRALKVAQPSGHSTEHYAEAGKCSLGDAVVILMRLESEGVAVRGRPTPLGMSWKCRS